MANITTDEINGPQVAARLNAEFKARPHATRFSTTTPIDRWLLDWKAGKHNASPMAVKWVIHEYTKLAARDAALG